jgi:RNA polymerase sigma-70 factor (ECF subfamily)
MSEHEELAARFETDRGHLRAVAYRMLGSSSEAEDAVQEVWLRLDRADIRDVQNLTGWLTTVVSRVCLDLLRARKARREDPVGQQVSDQLPDSSDPEQEAMQADSVGRALLVVLDALGPAERVALVLHDMFAVPFDQIAEVLGRSPVATKKLASRARQRVQGTSPIPPAELARQRQVVDAFLAASRGGDMTALLAVLAPDVVRRADRVALTPGVPVELRGAGQVAGEIATRYSPLAESVLVNGSVGIMVAPRGRLRFVLAVTIVAGKIAEYEVIADPARLRELTFAVLDY